jgi:predicted metalloprotease
MAKRFATFTKLAALLLAAAVLVACGSASATEQGPAPVATPQQNQSAQAACGSASLEGCFAFRQMPEFLDRVLPMVQQFFREHYPRLAVPKDVRLVLSGETGLSPCRDASGQRGRYTDASFEYCGANSTIYVGQDTLWAFYRIGDAAPVLAIAHEWAHHVQTEIGVRFPRTPAESVNFENQADCMAGAWAKYAREKGWLEYPDDVQDISSLVRAIGSREGLGRDHGTARERNAAFQSGFDTGLTACNRYSGTPITG